MASPALVLMSTKVGLVGVLLLAWSRAVDCQAITFVSMIDWSWHVQNVPLIFKCALVCYTEGQGIIRTASTRATLSMQRMRTVINADRFLQSSPHRTHRYGNSSSILGTLLFRLRDQIVDMTAESNADRGWGSAKRPGETTMGGEGYADAPSKSVDALDADADQARWRGVCCRDGLKQWPFNACDHPAPGWLPDSTPSRCDHANSSAQTNPNDASLSSMFGVPSAPTTMQGSGRRRNEYPIDPARQRSLTHPTSWQVQWFTTKTNPVREVAPTVEPGEGGGYSEREGGQAS